MKIYPIFIEMQQKNMIVHSSPRQSVANISFFLCILSVLCGYKSGARGPGSGLEEEKFLCVPCDLCGKNLFRVRPRESAAKIPNPDVCAVTSANFLEFERILNKI
jgi:hypothetical protein